MNFWKFFWERLVLISKITLVMMITTLFAYTVRDEMTKSLEVILISINLIVCLDLIIKSHPLFSSLFTINHVKKGKYKKEIDAIIDKSSKVRRK